MNTSPYGLPHRATICLVTALLVAIALFSPVRPSVTARAQTAETGWDTLRAGGKVALIRHALAPGTGDPASLVLDDCATQRNLSDEGRAQAARIGDAFRANGVTVEQVLSSGWCRCVDTATLAFGTAEVWPPLHSFFRDGSTEPAQTADVRARAAAWAGSGTLVMVTHQVNITALTDVFPSSGEVIVLEPAPDQPDGFVVAGRLVID